MNTYTKRQIEAEDILRSTMKDEDGVPEEVINEIITMVGDAERSIAASPVSDSTNEVIKLKLLDETDWKKRAALAAMLISKSLD
jgi:hypothetical protein